MPGMVVVKEAPESGFHEVVDFVEEQQHFVVVEYSLSTREMAAYLGLVEDAESTSSVNQEEIIMDYYKGDDAQ